MRKTKRDEDGETRREKYCKLDMSHETNVNTLNFDFIGKWAFDCAFK